MSTICFNLLLTAVGTGIGIPLVSYLNERHLSYCAHMGSYLAASCIFLSAVLFQLGRSYKEHRKSQKQKRKAMQNYTTTTNNDTDKHDKDCPQHPKRRELTNPQIPDVKKVINNGQMSDFDIFSDVNGEFNSSDASSNSDDHDDERGNISSCFDNGS